MRIGIDVGGTNIEACAVPSNAIDSSNVIYVHRAYPKGSDTLGLCHVLYGCIVELIKKIGITPSQIASVGIAVPGSVDIIGGKIIHAYNLDLHNAHITDSMKEFLPTINFSLINDADAATLGEFKLGALKGVNSGCMITLGTGVGAGIIINGELYRGGKMRGTEFGHVTLNIHGDKCTCGNSGCVETLCSATALANHGKSLYNDNTITAKYITERAALGDTVALSIFEEYLNALSGAIASYIALLDPERVVIGGGVSLAGDMLFKPLRSLTQKKSFFSPIGEIMPALLGDKAGAIGAAFA